LSGRTASGLSLATREGSFTIRDPAPSVFILYGALQDSICAKQEETNVIL
jgi:hypothetical protein